MPYSIHDHIQLRRVSSFAASPDGTWLAVTVERLDQEGLKYVSDLWRVPTDGSSPVQLTRGDCRDSSPCFRSDGELAFLSNRQPNEVKTDEEADKRTQIWILPRLGGEPYQLTDEPLGVEDFKFAKLSPRLVFFAPVLPGVERDKQRETTTERSKKGSSARRFTEQPVRHWDHWLHQNPDRANTHLMVAGLDGRNPIDLTPEADRQMSIEPQFDITEDGNFAAVSWQTPGSDRELDTTIMLIDLETRARTELGIASNVSNESLCFSPDGHTLAITRSFRSPKAVMRPLIILIDVKTHQERALAADWDRWPSPSCWANDCGSLLVTVEDEGFTPICRIDSQTGTVERLISLRAGGSHSNVEMLPDGRIASICSTLLRAPECVVTEAQVDSTPQRLAELSAFTAEGWAEVENCHTTSTDGAIIQFFLVKPSGTQPPLSTLLWIHGGPIGMDTDGWHWRWNPLLAVAAGHAVALPNPRGSTGFGQAFIQGIWGNVWGGQCYSDLMCVVDELEKRQDVDRKRIIAMGGSFGGYMTNWIGTQTTRFRCLVTHASIFTMSTFTGTTDHPAWWYLEMGGENPYEDARRFDRFAPVQHIANWKTPTLVIHGERDYRCPIGEGLNLFEALQYHGVASELLIFPDENHWILKPKNAVAWYDAVLEFIARHLAD